MAREPEKERLEKQRRRQQELRAKTAAEKRPSRDDVARVALYWFVYRCIEKGLEVELEKFQDTVVSMLTQQGFSEKASDEVMDDLVHKYRSGGWPFRRKVHLLYTDGTETDD